MASLYDRADIFDLMESDSRFQQVKDYWRTLLDGKAIHTFLDVSIGSGGLTLPLDGLGIHIAGSDLSEHMLVRCKMKAEKLGIELTLKTSDFRDVDSCFQQKFDCVGSTGNSLPYVMNGEVMSVLEKMDSLVRPDGYIYLDTRNWDKILTTNQRFFTYRPVYKDDMRIDVVQVWDYPSEDTIVFNILYKFEKDGKIVQEEVFTERYHPIPRELIVSKLKSMGYEDIQIDPFPVDAPVSIDECDWYSIIAHKP
jgi:SAM-dependent methyltransferase